MVGTTALVFEAALVIVANSVGAVNIRFVVKKIVVVGHALIASAACFWCVAAGLISASILQANIIACSGQELLSTASAIVIILIGVIFAFDNGVAASGIIASSR